jgi:D-xylose 1-dehydrogenase (NADP+, D-xylono-1,5-lactone-forming)
MSSNNIIRWGLLGTSRINSKIIASLLVSKRNHLLGVASRSLERALNYAREWDIPRAYGSYDALLADPEIDVIYNSLPNSLHAEWTVRAAENHKYILCEKPLAVSVQEVDEIIAATKRNRVIASEGFMYLHDPLIHTLKKLLDNGAIGALHTIRGSFTFSIEHDSDIRLNPTLGGGSILDSGCYPISLARFLIGTEPTEVFGWQKTGPTGVDIAFVGQLRFHIGSQDVYAQFDCGFQGPYRREVEIVGSNGSIRIANPYKGKTNELYLLNRLGEIDQIVTPKDSSKELYLGEIEDMADAIILGKPPHISLTSSRGNITAIVALLRSAKEKRPIFVEHP